MPETLVFLSWSGDRAKALAEALAGWLPGVLQHAKPWMSKLSIEAGSVWSTDLIQSLKSHAIGVVCLTPESQGSPFPVFEAGAIMSAAGGGANRVCPLLLGMKATDLKRPLDLFQAQQADREGIRAVVEMINRQADTPVKDEVLKTVFDRNWQYLESEIRKALSLQHEAVARATLEDQVEEILGIVKAMQNRREEELRAEVFASALDPNTLALTGSTLGLTTAALNWPPSSNAYYRRAPDGTLEPAFVLEDRPLPATPPPKPRRKKKPL